MRKIITPNPIPSINKNIAFNQDYDNIVEFDYVGYFNVFSKFDFDNALSFITLNPSVNNDQIKLVSDNDNQSLRISGLEGDNRICIMDMSGRVVMAKSVLSDESISISYLPKSVYLVKITGEKNNFTQKIIKE